MSIFKGITGALGGTPSEGVLQNLASRGAVGSIAGASGGNSTRGGAVFSGGTMTSDGYMSSADLQASQDREAARQAQRRQEIRAFTASKQDEINAIPQTSFATQEQAAGGLKIC